jgi:hypothetical protein
MVKDRLGNELAQGQLVEIKLGSPEVMAFVQEVKEGGIIQGVRGGGRTVTPGILVLFATFTFEYDPSNPILTNLVRLVSPDEEKPKAIPLAN